MRPALSESPRQAIRTRSAATFQSAAAKMTSMSNEIPSALRAQKYISLTTFRKTGAAVATPVWFGEQDGKLYVMTLSKMGKAKRIRNNPQVRVAPCTMRGKVTGPEFAAIARLLPKEDFARARKTHHPQVLDGLDYAALLAGRCVC